MLQSERRPLGFASVFAAMLCLTLTPRASAQRAPVVVKARLLLSTDAVHAGGIAHAAIVADIAPDYHINAHYPSLDYLIPTQLRLDPAKVFSAEKLSYPKGKPQKFAFSATPLSVYEGKIEIGADLAVRRGVAPGEYPLRGALTYQACNDRECFPPTSVPVALSVKIAAPHTPLHRINSEVFRTLAPE
ncbi:MAG: protein-disulfide reductase DsbD domain-containing protein [Terriglobia bacterium]